MADMGFMPQVEWVLRRLDQAHQTLLFSATLDGAVDRLVKRYLTDPVFHEVASSTQTVTLMEHRFLQVHQMDKVKVAAAICRSQEKSLLFVRTKRGADRLVENLGKEGVQAAAIHGDLRQANRERALADFSNGKLPVLVATDVAARGLHIEGVDGVIHFDPPEDHKAYLHRSGRTARAGKAGVVVSLSLWNQLVEMEVIQRRLGLRIPIVEMFSNDPRLADLAAWTPASRRERPLSEGPAVAVWSPEDGVRRVLVVTAHPDDVDFGSAGTVAAFTAAGRRGDLLHRHQRRRRRFGPLRCRGPRWPPCARTSSGPPRRWWASPTCVSSGIPTAWCRPPSSCAVTSAGSSARSGPSGSSPSRRSGTGTPSTPATRTTWRRARRPCARSIPTPGIPSPTPSCSTCEGLEPWTVPELWLMGPAGRGRRHRGGHDGDGASARWPRCLSTRARSATPKALTQRILDWARAQASGRAPGGVLGRAVPGHPHPLSRLWASAIPGW